MSFYDNRQFRILSLGPNIAIAVQLVLLYDFAAGTRVEFGFQVENLVLELPKKGPIPHPNMKFKKGCTSLFLPCSVVQ